MKLYFRVESNDLLSLESFSNAMSLAWANTPEQWCHFLTVGVYIIDNNEKTITYWGSREEELTVPKSFLLTWDYQKASDLYNKKIIGRFNEGKLKWTLMDFKAMEPMIKVLHYGLEKYDRDNWKNACPKKLDLLDSLERHYIALVSGEERDQDSGLPHIGHLMCNAMFYSYWEQQTNGLFENYKNN